MSNNKHASLLFLEADVSSLHTRLLNILCIILLILGIIGNVLGLAIFSSSHHSRRISPVYVYLATCSSITNLLCAIRYACILHSTSRHILCELVKHTWWACKIYELSFSFRVTSSWITLFWIFERLICVSTRLRSVFKRSYSFKLKLMPIVIISIILGCVIGPSVYMFQPTIIIDNDTMNSTIVMMHCDVSSNVSIEWQKYFHEIHFGINHVTIRCLFSELIPTGAIILFNSYTIYHIIQTYHRLHQASDHELYKKQMRATSWMKAVLLLHSFLFLSSLFAHIVGHFMANEAHETWWVSLAILINSALNFYVYCLSGKAFRNEIRRLSQCFKISYRYKI